jgi:hypothetical protein
VKVGDAVLFVGWTKKHKSIPEYLKDPGVGLIIDICVFGDLTRVNVFWSNGTIGTGLFKESLKMLSLK